MHQERSSPFQRSTYPAPVRPPTIRPRGRFSSEERSDDLWIFLGPRRRWGIVAFISPWLCGLAVGEVYLIAKLERTLSGKSEIPSHLTLFIAGFILTCLFALTVGGMIFLPAVLEEIWGWREIYLTRNLLFERRRIGRWTRDVIVPIDTIKEFRLTSPRTRRKDWEKVFHFGAVWARGLVVEHGNGKLLFLVREYPAESASLGQSVVELVRQALEGFRVPVLPLRPEPAPAERI